MFYRLEGNTNSLFFAQVTEKGNTVIDLTSEPTTEQTDLQRAIALSLKDTQQATTNLGEKPCSH